MSKNLCTALETGFYAVFAAGMLYVYSTILSKTDPQLYIWGFGL